MNSRRVAVLSLVASTLITPRAGVTATGDLQQRVSAAEPGSTVVHAGTFRGNLVVDRPLTLIGEAGATIDAGGSGSAVTVTASDVTIRGITIRNSGISPDREDAGVSSDGARRLVVDGCRFEDVLFGVFLRLSPDSVISNNTIGAKDLDPARRGDAVRIWESPGTAIVGNVVEGGRDTIVYYSDDVLVRDNRITGGRYGLHVMQSSRLTIERNVFEGNSVGVYVMYASEVVVRENLLGGNHGPSGYGLGLKDVDGLTVAGNAIVGNRVGVYFDNSPVLPGTTHEFSGNLIGMSQVGLLFNPSIRGNRFVGNAFVENTAQVSVTDGGGLDGNIWWDADGGNHWDDFRGFDADGDGIGDIPYRAESLYPVLLDRHPEIMLFAGTPAAGILDATARLFPAVRPEPRVVDEAPLVRRPAIPAGVPIHQEGPGVALTVAGAIMVGIAVTMVAWARRQVRR